VDAEDVTQKLRRARHWVFDLDGTLTVAVHDFAAIREALDIPPEADILRHLAALLPEQAASKRSWLLQHEQQLAMNARAAPGARDLVRALKARGCTVGILTRNSRELALLSLSAIGLADCFVQGDVIGRDECAPKPDPAGLLHLAAKWQVPPQDLVMVGDFRFDLECAKAAGSLAVLVGQEENLWPPLADVFAEDCERLLQML